jgi:RHS repeat-associated protein
VTWVLLVPSDSATIRSRTRMTISAACAKEHAQFQPISTGKERDTESGNDYFGARHYASSMGRFMSPDWSAKVEPVPYSKLDDPQSLNLYAYVGNNPLTGVDADGHMGSQAEATAQATEDWVNGSGSSPVGKRPGDAPAQQQSTNSATTTVTLNSRAADIPGGQLLHDAGVNHEWISTPDGTDVGMGTAKGVPQSDAPGVKTQVVDHTGQVPTSTQTFTGVNKAALATYTQVGTPTGRWVPGVNDCNTWAHNAINQSTPHDIYPGLPGISAVLYHNAVVYADGSIH